MDELAKTFTDTTPKEVALKGYNGPEDIEACILTPRTQVLWDVTKTRPTLKWGKDF